MNSVLTKEKISEFELFEKAKNGDERARNEIVERNIGLAVSVAVKFAKSYGTELEDLIQEGFIGLLTAIDKFDYTKGYKFSTYAVHYIRQRIQKYIRRYSKTLRLPANAYKKINQIFAAQAELEQTDGEASIKEISDITGLKTGEVAELLKLRNPVISLNQPIQNHSQENEEELINLIPDSEDEVDKELMQQELKHALEEALKTLPEKEQEIIKMRYGLTGKIMTLNEVAGIYGITKQRAGQIEKRALRRLKSDKRVKKILTDFLEK
ncbi:RNA polymerase primary sigma factor [Thermoanaerobacter thermohydrosulfuricus]|nr:RNA polymerase primary sigma factor [Thermoanaerobacter thermohydrosulfuricus]